MLRLMAASWQLLRLSLSRHTEPCILLGECTRDNLTVFTKPRRFGLRRWKPTKARLSAEVHLQCGTCLISAKRIPSARQAAPNQRASKLAHSKIRHHVFGRPYLDILGNG